MRIAEIFRSLQGEGRLTGMDSIFIRVCGCPLRCAYCDTAYASWENEGDELTLEEILHRAEVLADDPARARDPRPTHIVLTGGEPMMHLETKTLTETLERKGWHITIETAGTNYLPVACQLMSISPKMANSTPGDERPSHWREQHEAKRHAPDVIERLIAEYDYQFKFVMNNPEDGDEIEAYLDAFPSIDRRRVMLMPQGRRLELLREKATWLIPYCEAHGFTYCPRKHIEWFGPGRGK